MAQEITREDILKALEPIEHPEIAATLMELGMIQDIALDNDLVRVALALPTLGIPEAVRDIIIQSIYEPVKTMGLKMEVELFEMTDEAKQNFFALAQSRWKGSI